MIVLSGCNETKSTYKTKFEKTIAAMKAEDIPAFIQNHTDTKKLLWAFDDEIRTTEIGKYIIIPVVEGKKAFVFFGKDGKYLATKVYDRFKTKEEFDEQLKSIKTYKEMIEFDSNTLTDFISTIIKPSYHYTKEGIYIVDYRDILPYGLVKTGVSFIDNDEINEHEWFVPVILPEDRLD